MFEKIFFSWFLNLMYSKQVGKRQTSLNTTRLRAAKPSDTEAVFDFASSIKYMFVGSIIFTFVPRLALTSSETSHCSLNKIINASRAIILFQISLQA